MTTPHIPKRRDGRNTRKLRMLFGYEQQETFAKQCGWSQQKMSKLERQEVIDPEDMKVISGVLGIPAEKVIAFDEDKAVYNIQRNSSHDSSSHQSYLNYEPTFTQDSTSEKILAALTTLTKAVADLATQVAALKNSK
ncbi:helix-turn-helix domain-containing protein [Parapedobacter sp. 2B3]|uniref:helix-turn-helix domain-containing protein n=1 Tax=Parapedobacter sp. 2B3 TaxID=3342381 RepID=UPI0035B63EF4